MPNFFLSWAAGEDDLHVRQLFVDLRRAVSTLTGQPEPECGFSGGVPATLEAWPAGMVPALAESDVFVALWSPRYALNEACGRQLWIFEERLRRQGREPGSGSPALIVLAWALADPMPQLASATLVPEYGGTRRGVRQLVKLRGLRERYETFVADVAREIVAAAADSPPVLASIPALADTPSVSTMADDPTDQGLAGTPHVHFAVAAASRDEMDKVREDVRFYGPSPEDWRPYLPALTVPLAHHAQSVAAEALLQSDVGSLDDFLDRLEQARRDNQIVVLLVDWWATRLDTYRRMLAEIDRRGLGNTAVLVPANLADDETTRNRDDLGFALRRTFRDASRRRDPLFRSEIETPDRFDADLIRAIEEARNQVFRDGPVHHLPAGDYPGERPLLSGP
ncbi:FxsC protein [Phytohabitans sp. LJ34]|uniref:FxsC protein n=1 Tax=Phytohabitans sp. LJ34 TaxID=3452217 RepID=UPI003F89330F